MFFRLILYEILIIWNFDPSMIIDLKICIQILMIQICNVTYFGFYFKLWLSQFGYILYFSESYNSDLFKFQSAREAPPIFVSYNFDNRNFRLLEIHIFDPILIFNNFDQHGQQWLKFWGHKIWSFKLYFQILICNFEISMYSEI